MNTKKIKNYEIFSGEDLKIADLIQRRRYQILVHSCIYYKFGTSIVENAIWDKWAIELKELQEQYPEISKQVTLYEYFKDWDAITGFHLPLDLDWVIGIANRLVSDIGIPMKPIIVTKEKPKPKKKGRLF